MTRHVIMPNHVHFLMSPTTPEAAPLRAALGKFKGQTARSANEILRRTGAFWQADWFDRWMRDEAEIARAIDYIHNNPVKAGLVSKWQAYRWVR